MQNVDHGKRWGIRVREEGIIHFSFSVKLLITNVTETRLRAQKFPWGNGFIEGFSRCLSHSVMNRSTYQTENNEWRKIQSWFNKSWEVWRLILYSVVRIHLRLNFYLEWELSRWHPVVWQHQEDLYGDCTASTNLLSVPKSNFGC